ncbi:hypothetical protein D5086_001696 [Populus alba]|uniref:Uncharacterized protein n=1 Tax=Populus alba TaxID=43335 RepID=A0ACC4CZG9_POPAL
MQSWVKETTRLKLGMEGPWVRPVLHSYSTRAVRGIATRAPPFSLKSSTGLRERRPPVMSMPASSRPLASQSRSFERRPPPPAYAKSLKREYGRRRDEPPPSRSRPAVDFGGVREAKLMICSNK